jgi:hypothetical protein
MTIPLSISGMTTRSEKVKQFTEQSRCQPLPTHPRKMTRAEVEFLVKMNCGELMELLVTVTRDTEDARQVLKSLVDQAEYPSFQAEGKDDLEIMAEQADALIDIDYYNMNGAAKVGFNEDDVFDAVHEANMNKRSSEDGQFHRNSEGKVIKPVGWKEPDIKAVVARWIEKGTWSA